MLLPVGGIAAGPGTPILHRMDLQNLLHALFEARGALVLLRDDTDEPTGNDPEIAGQLTDAIKGIDLASDRLWARWQEERGRG